MRLIDGWWGDRAPGGADSLAFSRGAVEGEGWLSWGHRRCKRGFLRKVLSF